MSTLFYIARIDEKTGERGAYLNCQSGMNDKRTY